jgi:hypothetical protein
VGLLNFHHFQVTERIAFYVPDIFSPVQFYGFDGIWGPRSHDPGRAGIIVQRYKPLKPEANFGGIGTDRYGTEHLLRFEELDEGVCGVIRGGFIDRVPDCARASGRWAKLLRRHSAHTLRGSPQAGFRVMMKVFASFRRCTL